MEQTGIKVAHLLAQAANESAKSDFEYDEDTIFSLVEIVGNVIDKSPNHENVKNLWKGRIEELSFILNG